MQKKYCAGTFKQSMGAGPSRNRVIVPARYASGIDSLESIPGLLKGLKIRALDTGNQTGEGTE